MFAHFMGSRGASPSHPPPVDGSQFDKFGLLKRCRHLINQKIWVGIKDHRMSCYEDDKPQPTHSIDLTGATILENKDREIYITGPFFPHRNTWTLRAPTATDAKEWCLAFAIASAMGRNYHTNIQSRLLIPTNAAASENNPPNDEQKNILEQKRKDWYNVLEIIKQQANDLTVDESKGGVIVVSGEVVSCCLKCNREYIETVRRPLVLSCNHTFCDSCLSNDQKDGEIICYLCQKSTFSTIKDLRKNYSMELGKVNAKDYIPDGQLKMIEAVGASCRVCMEPFNETLPILLNCGHTICDVCLNGLVPRLSAGDLECAECRYPSTSQDVHLNIAMLQAVHTLLELDYKPPPSPPPVPPQPEPVNRTTRVVEPTRNSRRPTSKPQPKNGINHQYRSRTPTSTRPGPSSMIRSKTPNDRTNNNNNSNLSNDVESFSNNQSHSYPKVQKPSITAASINRRQASRAWR